MCTCVRCVGEGVNRRKQVMDNSEVPQPVPRPVLATICSEQPPVWELRVSMGTSMEVAKRTPWLPARRESGNQVEPKVTDWCVFNGVGGSQL